MDKLSWQETERIEISLQQVNQREIWEGGGYKERERRRKKGEEEEEEKRRKRRKGTDRLRCLRILTVIGPCTHLWCHGNDKT